jgi:superfamily II DNA/RNA helicase
MARIKPTPEQLVDVMARIPEGFIRQSTLAKRFRLHNKAADNVSQAIETGRLARENNVFYDPTRLTPEQANDFKTWCYPVFPQMNEDGTFPDQPIAEQIEARRAQLQQTGPQTAFRIFSALADEGGFAEPDFLQREPGDERVLADLIQLGLLQQIEEYVYDPLRLSQNTMTEVCRRQTLEPKRQELADLLAQRKGQTAPYNELCQQFGEDTLKNLLSLGGFSQFTVTVKVKPYTSDWVRLKEADAEQAHRVAAGEVRIKDDAWDDALAATGEMLRPGARDGKSKRIQVVARSYILESAAKRLQVREATLDQAIKQNVMPSFVDPEERARIPAAEVELARVDPDYLEKIAAFEVLKPRDISLVCNVSYSTVRRRLQRAKINGSEILWGEIRGKWNLPNTLVEFRELEQDKVDAKQATRQAELEKVERQKAKEREIERKQREVEREQRRELRAKLLAAFPTWKHEGRAEQQIYLHIGPPNSGKTHDALNVLAGVEQGWYLAPLRLLAYETFDRLNRRGVFCHLLTGEEYIHVPGAKITAATIEMFNPAASGDCIVIDEAQMLADPDRGWAWTRAFMEAQAPIVHIIAPATTQSLIEHMARAANYPIEVIEHERLAPIKIADNNWPLSEIPERTILVAFSRRTVLQLKTELEEMKRKVSVVYGNLPPEVRRKQADRFADGETEICIATDAVGMGLNLPADYVCFYEIEKFDGKSIRQLTPTEIQQIGGRAGRYGLSKAGEIGATRKKDLKLIRKLYYDEPATLTHARVAPTVDDLAMIPGNLAAKLGQWSLLQSIPERLRTAIKTADLDERIELAKMLQDEEVERLGLSGAVELINAPTRQSSRAYWRECASAILSGSAIPLPKPPPREINNNEDLEATEWSVSCADIYLWLSRRRDFAGLGSEEPRVRQLRHDWSMQIDAALLTRLDMSRRCPSCGEPLPLGHRHRLCNNCYFRRVDRNGRYS